MTGVAGVALFLELLFRILPVSSSTATGYYTDPLILTYPPHHRWTTATGWDLRNARKLEANNLGYVAGHDFEINENAVALVGDSFVEASMLAAEDRPGEQLERELGARPVYAVGSPGTALLDYAERIRFMHEHFHVRDFVIIMERGDVLQSLCGSGNVHGRCLEPKTLEPRIETLPPPSMGKRLLRYSALAQYLVSQIRFSPREFWQHVAPSRPAELVAKDSAFGAQAKAGSAFVTSTATPAVDAVTNTFFARVKPHLQGKLIIVLDTNRAALYVGTLASDPERSRFINLARAAGAIVIDTEPLVRSHLARSQLKLDVGPYDGHLNSLGIRLYAEAAAAELKKP